MNEFFKFRSLDYFFKLIRAHGGIIQSIKNMHRLDVIKLGTMVGEDKFGNRYYENDLYLFGSNRWVIYADHVGLNYDASQVPPEWYGWLHYKTDYLPHKDPTRPKYKWMLEPTENLTGTNRAYMPYSTTQPKIHVWKPKSS